MRGLFYAHYTISNPVKSVSRVIHVYAAFKELSSISNIYIYDIQAGTKDRINMDEDVMNRGQNRGVKKDGRSNTQNPVFSLHLPYSALPMPTFEVGERV